MSNKKVFICAGEASGDTLGSLLATALLKKTADLDISGMGGSKMKEAGVKLLFPYDDIAVVGFIEVLTHFPAIRKAFQTVKNYIINEKPDLIIFIDYPGFNLRMAKFAKTHGVKVLYYVSPQIWAWKKGRIHHIKRYVDHMAVLFAFEKPIYEKAGVKVSFVGHPLVNQVHTRSSKEAIFKTLKLDPNRRVIALLPGSRLGEIQRLAPCLEECAKNLEKTYPDLQFVLPLASHITPNALPQGLNDLVTITRNQLYDTLSISDAAITVSGTVTLEVALMGVPMAIIYRVNELTYWIARFLVNISHIGLCNIVAEKEVAPEFIQSDMTADKICGYIEQLLNDHKFYESEKSTLSLVKAALSKQGNNPSEHVAEIALSML